MFKAQWATEGDNVRLSMPFTKVDAEKRIVSGFATLDNVDKQNDIVTTEASLKAFSKFRGNIREMHQPSAVGKMVSFKEDKYFDPETKKFYSGVYVSAYISKGAQNTWEKVTDGTYTGFSIGGRMNKWDDAYDEKADLKVRVIKDYDLVELSLVDNPANQFASILSVEKNADGVNILKGESMDVEIENVFWDKDSGIVMLSEEEEMISPATNEPMQNIGFVEKSDADKKNVIKFLVDGAKGIDLSKITKEVSPMTDETQELVEKSEEVVADEVAKSEEVAPEADAAAEVEVADETKSDEVEVEEADDSEAEVEVEKTETAETDTVVKADEVTEEAVEVSKSDDDVAALAVADIKDTITSAFSDLAETVKSLHAEVNALKKSITGVSDEVAAAKQELSETKGQFDEFGKRFEAVEADTAFRKSGDLGEIVQDEPELVQKSLWGGRFLKTADLFK
jgi:outer membrane murein-binding lipoprotein Lpp